MESVFFYSNDSLGSQMVYYIPTHQTAPSRVTNCYVWHGGNNPHPFVVSGNGHKLTVTNCIFEVNSNANAIVGSTGLPDLELTNNLLTTGGVLFTTLTQGAGAGKTLNITNNTTITRLASIHQGLLLAETNGDWVGSSRLTNNLMVGPATGYATGFISSTGKPATLRITDLSHNGWYHYDAIKTDPGKVITVARQSNNLPNVDPSFADATRTLASWGKINHRANGTVSGAMAVLLAMNGYNGTTKTQSDRPKPGIVSELISWVKAGYVAKNPKLQRGGEGGGRIGAYLPDLQ